MPHANDFAQILQQLRAASDGLAVARQIVLDRGGYWADDPPASGIFEVQILGLVGIGPSAETAVEDWIAQAEIALAKPLTRTA